MRISVTALLTLILCGPVTAQPAPDLAQPNILWITVEDLSPRIGAYGDTLARTPNIDRLAAEGIRYTNAFTTAGVCSPSRAAIFMGMYQTSFGAQHMRTSSPRPGFPDGYDAVAPPYAKGFTENLRLHGYYTANYGKTDYQVAHHMRPREPLTAWDVSEGYRANATTAPVWRKRPEGQPFFVVLNDGRTHESRVWPDLTEKSITDPASVVVPPYYPDTPTVRRDIARHYDNIARMDDWVGEILQLLEDDDLADNTIVFFWSDHGDGFPRAKRWLYDAGLRVPLIVRMPDGFGAGTQSDELISFVDLAPTVTSLADAGDIPDHWQGRAFLGRKKTDPPEYVFAARDRIDDAPDRVRAVTDGRFKYILNYYPEKPYILDVAYRDRMPLMQELLALKEAGTATGPVSLWLRDQRDPEELYDTMSDPDEINNLAQNPAFDSIRVQMRRALELWQEDTGDMGDIPEDEMVKRWWPAGVKPQTAAPVVQTPCPHDLWCATLSSPTEGASIAWTLEGGDEPHWLLYAGQPVSTPAPATLRARAVRYGYQESEEVEVKIGR